MQTTDLLAKFNGIADRVFNKEYNQVKHKLGFNQDPQWNTLHQAAHHNYEDGSGMISMQFNLNNEEAQELQGNFQEALAKEVENILLKAGQEYYGRSNANPHAKTLKVNDFCTAVSTLVWNDQPYAWATIGGSDTSIMLQVQTYWQ